VQQALRRAGQDPAVVCADTLDESVRTIIADASGRYRLVQKDRSDRLESILRLSQAQHGLQLELHQERVAGQQISSEADRRERALHELAAVVKAGESRVAELEGIAAERLDALERAANLLGTLQAESAERLQALEQTHAAFERFREEAQQWERGVRELHAVIEARNGRIAALEAESAERLQAQHDASEMLATLQAKDERIVQLQAAEQGLREELCRIGQQFAAAQKENDGLRCALKEAVARGESLSIEVLALRNATLLDTFRRKINALYNHFGRN
jgi:chromosome segregation ATPase